MFLKAPADILDYTWDWSVWMPTGDSISTVNWEIPETFLPSPADLIINASTNGGSLAAEAWYYVVTAVNTAGETTPSNEVTVTTTGTTSSIQLGWNEVVGATAYNVYRGSNATGTPVTVDGSATGTIGHNSGSTSSLTATCSWTKGTANYAVAIVPFLAGLQPNILTCNYGSNAMSLAGTVITGFGGVAIFELASPPSGAQTITANVQSYGNVIGMGVAVQTFAGVGSAVFTGSAGRASSPSQTVPAVYGDLVVWGAANVTGSSINAALSSFNQTSLQNSGNISLPIADQIAFLLGYAAGPTTAGASSVSFTANVAQANIDQWWSAAALTLLPAAPPINTLVTTVTSPSTTQYVDIGSAGITGTPPAANGAVTSIAPATSPAASHTTNAATAWIAFGTAGNSYPITCQIVTAQGRVAQNTQSITVENM